MEPPTSRLHEKLKHLTPQQRAQALSILRKLIPENNAEALREMWRQPTPEVLDVSPDPLAPDFVGTYSPPPPYTVESDSKAQVVSATTPTPPGD